MFQFLFYSDGVESGNGTHISIAIKRYVEPMLKLYVPSKVEFEIKMLHSQNSEADKLVSVAWDFTENNWLILE